MGHDRRLVLLLLLLLLLLLMLTLSAAAPLASCGAHPDGGGRRLLAVSSLRPQRGRQRCLSGRSAVRLVRRGGAVTWWSAGGGGEALVKEVAASRWGRLTALTMGCAHLLRYHVSLVARERAGERTWRTSLALARRKWAIYVFETEGWLYAVQGLRNGISASTFLTSVALSLMTLIAGFLLREPAHLTGQWRCTPMCVALGAAAFHFSQSARYLTHCGFLFPITATSRHFTPQSVETLIVRSEFHQWRGQRALHHAIVFAIWPLAGEYAFFLSTLAVHRFFISIDRPVPTEFDSHWALGQRDNGISQTPQQRTTTPTVDRTPHPQTTAPPPRSHDAAAPPMPANDTTDGNATWRRPADMVLTAGETPPPPPRFFQSDQTHKVAASPPT